MLIPNTAHQSVGQRTFPFSSLNIVYKAKNGNWRGFVAPYDITYEADSKEEVSAALKDMLELYEDGLKEYNNPPHLTSVPYSDPEDREKFSTISSDLLTRFVTGESTVDNNELNYYAEANLPA